MKNYRIWLGLAVFSGLSSIAFSFSDSGAERFFETGSPVFLSLLAITALFLLLWYSGYRKAQSERK